MSTAPGPARLVELAVTDLGIIADLRLLLAPGMTALTGETGAGKTMVLGAIELLLGGRADAGVVRPGATEAVVEGRFLVQDDEVVITRVVPADGRSRAYIDGRMATAAGLTDVVGSLVDLHGQHAHQSLLATAVQRASLDRFGGVDLAPLEQARADRRTVAAQLAALGGDQGAREREIDLLRFQHRELEAAELQDPDEDQQLSDREDLLAGALAHREAAAQAVEGLVGDGGAIDAVAAAGADLRDRAVFADASGRLAGVLAELHDIADGVRGLGEAIEEDPGQLDALRQRRQLLVDLRRKYGSAPASGLAPGDGTLAAVIAYRDHLAGELDRLARHDADAAALEARLAEVIEIEARAAAVVGARRRAVAGDLADRVGGHLAELAMAKARLTVVVGEKDPGDDVQFLLAANPGLPPGPLAKVASGGELARTMLALRLVVSGAPPILVFDEVDAGIGGDAAVAVGRALAALGRDHQVLVVTHLPQVAAFADHQVSVRKEVVHGVAVMEAASLDPDDRVAEVARMLGGSHGGAPILDAARELLSASSRSGAA